MNAKNNGSVPMQERHNWIKVPELAKLSGLSQTKIRELIEEGKIPASRLGNGYYRIARAEAERFIAEGFRHVPKRAN